MKTLTDRITGQPITRAELDAEIVMLKIRIAASPNEFVERLLLGVLRKRQQQLKLLSSKGN